jgi:hypothetical protein
MGAQLSSQPLAGQAKPHRVPGVPTAMPKTRSRVLRVVLAAAVPVLLLLLGGFLGRQVMPTYLKLQRALSWRQLPAPPEPPISIASVAGSCIAVEVASGDLYSTCDLPPRGDIDWQSRDTPLSVDGVGPSPCQDSDLPAPPDHPVALVDDCYGGELVAVSRFALYADGALWSYQYISPNIGTQIIGSLTAILLGAMLGLFAGIRLVVPIKSDPATDRTNAGQ